MPQEDERRAWIQIFSQFQDTLNRCARARLISDDVERRPTSHVGRIALTTNTIMRKGTGKEEHSESRLR